MRFRSLHRPNVVHEVSKLELAAELLGVACGILLLAFLWMHIFAFHEMEARQDLWLEETVSRIELWRQER